MKPHEYLNAKGNVLILKRINKSRFGYKNFQYPTGIGSKITCPDWSPAATCGGGIHGWPWGFGLGEGMDFDITEDVWLVLADKPENVVGELEGGWKCKAKEPVIVFEGSFKNAFGMMTNEWPKIIAGMKDAASDKYSKLTSSGDNSKLAASGDGSNLAASGDRSQLAASGDGSNLAASGDRSQLAASGYGSKLVASGNGSKLVASGENSVCMVAGVGGTVKVGKTGYFVLNFFDGTRNVPVVGIVGENGICPDTTYTLDYSTGKIISC